MKRSSEDQPSTSKRYIGFDDLTDCSICLDTLENPKKLPCDHSFCEKCVIPLKKKCPRMSKFYVQCPMDKKRFWFSEIQPDFKQNRFLERLAAERKEIEDSKKPPEGFICDVCDENAAEGWCKSCSDSLCRICIKAHAKFRADHTVLSIEEKQKEIRSSLLVKQDDIDSRVQRFDDFVEEFDKQVKQEHNVLREYETRLDKCQ